VTEAAVVEELYLGIEYKRRGRGKFQPLVDDYFGLPIGYFETYPSFVAMGDTDANGFTEYSGAFYYDACGTAKAVLGDIKRISFRLLTTLELENGREFNLRTEADCSDYE
jgi:hypothetical protein